MPQEWEDQPDPLPSLLLVWYEYPIPWITGNIFVDGSGSAFRWLWEAVRVGCGVAQVTGREFIGGFYGTLAGDNQTVPREEMVAIARALAVAKKRYHHRAVETGSKLAVILLG